MVNRKINLFYIIIAWLIILIGCTPAIRSSRYTEEYIPPKPTNYPIRVYRTTLPTCPFEEIGHVSARQRNKLITMDSVMDALRDQAREMGGDAIIGLSEDDQTQGGVISGGSIILDRDPVLSGTVIRFTDPDCTK